MEGLFGVPLWLDARQWLMEPWELQICLINNLTSFRSWVKRILFWLVVLLLLFWHLFKEAENLVLCSVVVVTQKEYHSLTV